MIVVRHNFETNSSSMHSLSVRKTDGTYSAEEARMSEAIRDEPKFDVIITANKGHRIRNKEQLKSEMWIWSDKLHFSSYELDFINSPMQVLAGPREKLKYAVASAMSSENAEQRIAEVKTVFAKILPHINFELEKSRFNVFARGRCLSGGVERDILGPFLKDNNISLEDFIVHQKYIVIVNYAEYTKMKNLNMVNESTILSRYPEHEFKQHNINIVNGVWSLTSNDLSFGRTPFRVLGTPEGKARYILASTRCANLQEVTEIMRELYPELKEIRVFDKGYCDDSVFGYKGISARELILDKKYVIISDGDEYCIWNEFKKTPLFNKAEYPDEKAKD